MKTTRGKNTKREPPIPGQGGKKKGEKTYNCYPEGPHGNKKAKAVKVDEHYQNISNLCRWRGVPRIGMANEEIRYWNGENTKKVA